MSNERDDIDPAAYRFADAAKDVIALVAQGIDALAQLTHCYDSGLLHQIASRFAETIELQIARLILIEALRRYKEGKERHGVQQTDRDIDETSPADDMG